ncbi:DUF2335 domain-containing protein [Patescibacteria group bacterium]
MSKNNKIQNDSNNKPAIVSQSVHFSGPLPHPDILRKFDEVYPGAAKIIIDMAKEQSGHRQILEKDVINSDIKNSRLGLWFGFIIAITGLILGVVLIYFGNIGSGLFISGGTIVSLVGTFVYGSQGRRKEREEKK